MKFELTEWSIKKLIDHIDKDKICLNPPYQRNPIWTKKAQRLLINTIKSSQPIPNFFLLKRSEDNYEMVDGQQRARTIVGYWRGFFDDSNGILFDKTFTTDTKNKSEVEAFLNYRLSITIIEKVDDDESIEEYYALVNSSGLRLNRPELKKAEYFNTNFLILITDLADYPDFRDLKLFTPGSMNRMNDVDFISELVAILKYGISDKKEKVDIIFEEDISDEEFTSLSLSFKKVMRHFKRFDSVVPLNGTRFGQKNDFYSFFNFINTNLDLDDVSFDYYYRLLLKLSKYIRPSQEKCDPLMKYAYNCVTQSNSKQARLNRHSFFTELLLNEEAVPNETQKAIMIFFGMNETALLTVATHTTLDIDAIDDPVHPELPLEE